MAKKFLLATAFLLGSFLLLTSFDYPFSSLENEVLASTNKLRKAKGLAALQMRDDLNDIAVQHSKDMASGRRRFGHDGFKDREKKAIKSIPALQSFAENVAYGPVTGEEVVKMWKGSNGHRKNMLGDFKYIGIGTATDKAGRIYYTQVFVK